MREALPKKKPLPWWRWVLLVLVLAAMVPLGGVMVGGYFVEKQFGNEIIKISRAGEPITFRDLHIAAEPNVGGEDAVSYYSEALGNIHPDSLEKLTNVRNFYRRNIISLPADQFPGGIQKIVDELSELKMVFEKFDKGADLPLSFFDIGIEQEIKVYKSRVKHIQNAVILMSLRTMDSITNGRDEKATGSVISMLKMTRMYDFQPTIVLHGTKIICLRMACQDIELLLMRGRLSETSLSKLQKTLSESIAPNALERTFLAERLYHMEVARNLMPKDAASLLTANKAVDLPRRISLPGTLWGQLKLRRKATSFFRNMSWLIEASRKPWPEPLNEIIDNPAKTLKKSGSLFSNSKRIVRLTGDTLSLLRCTVLSIALERYRLGRGRLPGSLEELLPTYIDSIPVDPFTGEKLLYKYDEESYIVYSAGDNRQDDGGTIVPRFKGENPLDYGLRIRFRKSR